MLVEALAALAAAGGNALVSAMVTDGWEGVRVRFARLLGRGDPKATDDAAARLEGSHAVLVGDLPRAFRTANYGPIHAAGCCSRYSLWTCCGVRY